MTQNYTLALNRAFVILCNTVEAAEAFEDRMRGITTQAVVHQFADAVMSVASRTAADARSELEAFLRRHPSYRALLEEGDSEQHGAAAEPPSNPT
jgi:hypothetical protein